MKICGKRQIFNVFQYISNHIVCAKIFGIWIEPNKLFILDETFSLLFIFRVFGRMVEFITLDSWYVKI